MLEAPYAANELNKIINLKIFTNPDGSVVNVQIIDVAFYKKDPVYRAAADSARRAVKDCSPLPLPKNKYDLFKICLLYTSPSPRDVEESRMPSSA